MVVWQQHCGATRLRTLNKAVFAQMVPLDRKVTLVRVQVSARERLHRVDLSINLT
jgi:hypothetical protein